MKMNVAIMGVGRMGRRHIYSSQKLGLSLKFVSDISEQSLAITKQELSLPDSLIADSISDVFTPPPPECIIIATTADSHCQLVCQAAEAGVQYILVEKPMAVSLEQCDRMIETCNRYGAKLAVNHQMRFMDQYTRPKRLLETEEYGGLTSMTVVGGNFGFAMNGTHYFEAFRYVANEAIVEVTAWFSPEIIPNPRGPQFEDRAGSIRAITASGKRLYIDIGSDQGHGIRAIYAAKNGMIAVNELSGEMVTSVREKKYTNLPTTRYGMPGVDSQQNIEPAEVIDSSAAVLNALINNTNNVSGECGRQSIAVLVAAYQSAENGSIPVRLDSHLNRSRIFPWA
ncbi:Gfo/Idh/MocA family protein [Laspinema olomoucense]|uniref:Gfo/Idh/MocA family protein n=1 Tax=Laspinema olomoucense TaxID=3231600 RepID=UPI0021BB4AA7|nr:Gfo/Idh/MocA family oxidoreductase [Laspinema sp. D3c]MCT7995220.1 Gfo/Idh/MocA family oxidoreductase [Laspinema sp. D3c]